MGLTALQPDLIHVEDQVTCPPEFVVECKGPHHCPHLTELQALVWALVAWGAVAAEAPSTQHSPALSADPLSHGKRSGITAFPSPLRPWRPDIACGSDSHRVPFNQGH